MIHVLEMAPTPAAWFAYDEADLLSKVGVIAPLQLAELRHEFSPEHLMSQGLSLAAADAFLAAAALRQRGPCRVYWTESEALAAFEANQNPDWQGAGWRARLALRNQLIALEVLADDL
jgi:hypothetical protein